MPGAPPSRFSFLRAPWQPFPSAAPPLGTWPSWRRRSAWPPPAGRHTWPAASATLPRGPSSWLCCYGPPPPAGGAPTPISDRACEWAYKGDYSPIKSENARLTAHFHIPWRRSSAVNIRAEICHFCTVWTVTCVGLLNEARDSFWIRSPLKGVRGVMGRTNLIMNKRLRVHTNSQMSESNIHAKKSPIIMSVS